MGALVKHCIFGYVCVCVAGVFWLVGWFVVGSVGWLTVCLNCNVNKIYYSQKKHANIIINSFRLVPFCSVRSFFLLLSLAKNHHYTCIRDYGAYTHICMESIFIYVCGTTATTTATTTVDLKSWKQIWFNKKKAIYFYMISLFLIEPLLPPPIVGVAVFSDFFFGNHYFVFPHSPMLYICTHKLTHAHSFAVWAHWDTFTGSEWQR